MFILKTRNVVPALLLAGVSGRYVVPELLLPQQQGPALLPRRASWQQRRPGVVVAPGCAVFPELARRRAGPRQTATSIASEHQQAGHGHDRHTLNGIAS
jgi:hypothetical protein